MFNYKQRVLDKEEKKRFDSNYERIFRGNISNNDDEYFDECFNEDTLDGDRDKSRD